MLLLEGLDRIESVYVCCFSTQGCRSGSRGLRKKLSLPFMSLCGSGNDCVPIHRQSYSVTVYFNFARNIKCLYRLLLSWFVEVSSVFGSTAGISWVIEYHSLNPDSSIIAKGYPSHTLCPKLFAVLTCA
jgi:hypothetical protein